MNDENKNAQDEVVENPESVEKKKTQAKKKSTENAKVESTDKASESGTTIEAKEETQEVSGAKAETESKPEVKETPKEKAEKEVKEETNKASGTKSEKETKEETKEEAKAEVIKEEAEQEAKAEVKAEVKAEAKEETKEEAKAETKEAPKTKSGKETDEVTGEAPEAKDAAPPESADEVAEPAAETTPEVPVPVAYGDSAGDFDWDNFDKQDEKVSDDSRIKFESLYDETLSTIAEAEVIDGTVISLNKREVVINIGYKSEGVVSLNEFRYNPELAAGDTVEVYVESQEDKKGQLVLSHKQARAMRSWDRVNAALDQDEIIKGYIKCRTKGGMIVDVFGIEAFLPGSQIDVKPIRDYDAFVGKTMEFKVVKINHEFKNVVVSHKALIEAERNNRRKRSLPSLKKGRYLKEQLRISLPTVYLLTLVVLTV